MVAFGPELQEGVRDDDKRELDEVEDDHRAGSTTSYTVVTSNLSTAQTCGHTIIRVRTGESA